MQAGCSAWLAMLWGGQIDGGTSSHMLQASIDTLFHLDYAAVVEFEVVLKHLRPLIFKVELIQARHVLG